MSTDQHARVEKGIPSGGQFAATAKADDDLDLTETKPVEEKPVTTNFYRKVFLKVLASEEMVRAQNKELIDLKVGDEFIDSDFNVVRVVTEPSFGMVEVRPASRFRDRYAKPYPIQIDESYVPVVIERGVTLQ